MAGSRGGDIAGRAAAISAPDDEDTSVPFRFPFVGSVERCTATLISPSHLLLAAHCVESSVPTEVSFSPRYVAAERTDKIPVAGCWMNPRFTALHAGSHGTGTLREEFTPATAGDRCAVFILARGIAPGVGTALNANEQREDYAVLLLERPIPHEVADATTVGAGEVFDSPIPVTTTPPESGTPFDGIAVGYGPTASHGPGGVRRFVHLTLTGARNLITSGSVILTPGDSGGPLLIEVAGRSEVVAVASTGSSWAVVANDTARAWIGGKVDPDGDGRPSTFCARGAPRESDPAADAANDADGDWVLDSADSCPTTYNPCQETSDVDGDGVADDCDGCPTEGAITDLRGTLSDSDRDAVPDACDCHPDTFDTGDLDLDLVRNGCDNCPRDPNPFQDNADGDGEGDACDLCPLHARATTDSDGDGVPDPCDDCAMDPNPAQLNCNADAEAAAVPPLFEPDTVEGLVGVGDACDPIPCGDTRVGLRSTLEARDGRDARVYRPTVLVDPVAVPARSARAGFRFCRCALAVRDDLRTRRACALPVGDAGGCLIADNDDYDDFSTEEPPWLLASLVEDATAGTRPALRREYGLRYEPPGAGFVPELERDWLLDDDIDRWSALFPEPIHSPPAGILWTRAPGPRSGGEFPVGSDEYDLAHHYLSGPVDPGGVAFAPRPDPCFQFFGPFLFDRSFCPLCASAFPAPWMGTGFVFRPDCPPPLGEPEIMLSDGLLEAAPSFATDPAPLFEVTGSWVAASEPRQWLPDQGLRYAAVLPSGAIERLLVQTPLGIADAAQPQPQPCPNCVEPFLHAGASAEGPAPIAVLSARRSILWVLRDHEIVMNDLDREVSVVAGDPSSPLGRILAATYEPSLDRVVVLDEVLEHRGGTRRPVARLVALHPITGELEVVARIPRTRPATQFAMAPDGDGGVWIASSADFDGHAAVLLSPWRSATVAGWALGTGTLASRQARADRRGLSLAVVRHGETAVVGHAVADLLPGSPGTLRRCF